MIRPVSTPNNISPIVPRSRTRKPAPFKKVDVRRAIDAVKAGGLAIASVEIRPDGTIRLSSLEAAAASSGADAFSEWESRL